MKPIKIAAALLFLATISKAFGQLPSPSAYQNIPQVAIAGLNPQGTYSYVSINFLGALVDGGGAGTQTSGPTNPTPFAPVAVDPNGKFQYLQIDSNGNLKVLGGNGLSIKEGGAILNSEPILALLGSGVTCVDNPTSTETDCTFSVGSGSLPSDTAYTDTQQSFTALKTFTNGAAVSNGTNVWTLINSTNSSAQVIMKLGSAIPFALSSTEVRVGNGALGFGAGTADSATADDVMIWRGASNTLYCGNSQIAGTANCNLNIGTLTVGGVSLGSAAFQPASAFAAAGSTGGSAAGALLATNNLSDLNSVSAARANLGLGTAALSAATAFDAAGLAALALQKASNLSDLSSAATARTNLGLGSAALSASTAFDANGVGAAVLATSVQKANNLSDLASYVTALANLHLTGSGAQTIASSTTGTAVAFATNPTQCGLDASSNQKVAIGISANGTPNCVSQLGGGGGGASGAADLTSGTIDGTVIGSVTPAVAYFTQLSIMGSGSGTGLIQLSGTGGYKMVTATGAAPVSNPPSGNIEEWASSTNNIYQTIDSSGNISSMVKASSGSAGQVVGYIDNTGTQQMVTLSTTSSAAANATATLSITPTTFNYETLTASVTSFTLVSSSAVDGKNYDFVFCENSTGGFTIVQPTNSKNFFPNLTSTTQMGFPGVSKCTSQVVKYMSNGIGNYFVGIGQPSVPF